MSTTTTSPFATLIFPLIDCGSRLAALLQSVKLEQPQNPDNTEISVPSLDPKSIHEDVNGIIDEFQKYSTNDQDPVLKRCMANVMSRIQEILQEFVKINDAMYRELAEKVNGLKSELLQSAASISSLSSLVKCGSYLALLQKRVDDNPQKVETLTPAPASAPLDAKSVYEVVKGIIDELLEYANSDQDPVLKESMAKIMGKMEKILEKFSTIDKDTDDLYQKLAKKITDFKTQVEEYSAKVATSVDSSKPDTNSASTLSDDSPQAEESDDEFQSKYNSLNTDEKQCLFYFSLFPKDAEIKKRDLIFWWIGMGLVSEYSDDDESKTTGEKVIAKLVKKGLVDPLVINKKLSNTYKLRPSFHSKVQRPAVSEGKSLKATQEGSFSVMHCVHDKPDGHEQTESEKIEGLFNISSQYIDAKTFERLSKMKNGKVVHLGSWGIWQHGSSEKDYILLEDIDSLHKALKNLVEAKFLGLQGISGIVKLPDSVYQLQNLEVLDLRACNNLELLPEGIKSLQKLTHLDLSECFLLGHIPKGITRLSKLMVLKGFVINPDEDIPEDETNNKQKSKGSSCAFSDLAKLTQLRKLSLRTRRMNFPTKQDLQTLCEMKHVDSLRIAWVGNSSDAQIDGDLERFPATVKKLELRTVPTYTASRLLALISKEKESLLEKLYIKGGGLRELDPEKHTFSKVKAVRLRYLSKLDTDWEEFLKLFPNLTTLKVFKCPNLAFFPCDEDGWWEK